MNLNFDSKLNFLKDFQVMNNSGDAGMAASVRCVGGGYNAR